MKRKPYPKYKDSGVEWLGQVPEHWEVRRLKFSLLDKAGSIKTGPFGSQLKSEDMNGSGIKVYNQMNVIQQDLSAGDDYVDEQKYTELSAFEVFADDILVTTRGTIGRCIHVPTIFEKGILHPCLMRIQLNEQDLSFAFFTYLLQESKLLLIELKLNSNATTLDVVYSDTLKNLVAPIPPLTEQSAIAAFLDQKTSQIDALIQKKKELIAKLGEQRIALITQAVTKGLNPKVKFKDSGVEWLGQVPEHWEVRRLKFDADSLIGITYSPEDVVQDESGILVMRASNIQEGELSFRDNVYVAKDVQERDILVCARNGSAHLVGKCAYITKEHSGHTFGAFMAVVRSKIGRYLYLFFSSSVFTSQTGLYKTSTINQLTSETLNSLVVALPPSDEQLDIATFLDQKTAQIDALVRKTGEAVAKLEEYRMAVITAAVTGKVDVRN